MTKTVFILLVAISLSGSCSFVLMSVQPRAENGSIDIRTEEDTGLKPPGFLAGCRQTLMPMDKD